MHIANRLSVNVADIQDFIGGSATGGMTACLGLRTMSATKELARSVGQQGAIGIVLGLLLAEASIAVVVVGIIAEAVLIVQPLGNLIEASAILFML